MQKVEVSVWEGKNELWTGISKTPLEIGRQQEGDPGPLDLQDLVHSQRLVIAPVSARSIPRQALRVEAPEPGVLRISNIHPRLAFFVGTEGKQLDPGQMFEANDEIVVSLPEDRTVRIQSCEADSEMSATSSAASNFRTISSPAESTMENIVPVRLNELFGDEKTAEDNGRAVVALVRAALTVVRQAAGSDEFFDSAVESVASMIELDRTYALLREGTEWKVQSAFSADPDASPSDKATFSRGLVDRVMRTGETIIYDPANYLHTTDSSMMALDRAVAAPIFDEDNKVIGALYGDRRFGSGLEHTPIGDLEAALLEVMAGAVSSGLARQRQEEKRSNFAQFFSPAVSELLENDFAMLDGRDAEVTVLFCDIRGFSTISERVGPKRTIEWINDVLTELSQCVMRTDGVLVDYIGDELMAMWGAPVELSDHANRACTAAIDMLSYIEPLRERWKEITPDKFGFGIGINTGIARVGNTGSKVKFKYGPLGNTVNLASRVQGITKKLGVEALITETTAEAVGRAFDHRRLAKVRPLGFVEPVCLHELKRGADEEWRKMKMRYESALAAFDTGDLANAASQLATLVHEHPGDNPSVVLLGRVVDGLTGKEDKVDPVWDMKSK